MEKDKKEELKKIALGIYKGLIFTDMHCDSAEEVTKVFMPIALGDDNSIIKGIDSGEIAMIYEYMEKAGRWAINGKPMFVSCNYLNKEEKDIVMDYLKKLDEAEKSVLNGES